MNWNFVSLMAISAFLYTGTCSSAPTNEKIDPTTFTTQSTFTLNGAPLITKNAFVTLTDEFFSGQTTALKILFTSEPITNEARINSLNKGNDEKLTNYKDHAYLVLFLDKNNEIWQVNYTVVLTGKTVARTLAWKPNELLKFSSNYMFDGKRVKLNNKGKYQDQKTENDPVTITWDVNFNLPVFVKNLAAKTDSLR